MRQMWTGSISFGLIHIPIKLYSATKESRIDFEYLRKKDLCPIKYVRVCKDTGEEVPFKEIVRGYEYEKGDYIVLADEDFKKASPEKTETIEIIQFIHPDEVDTMLLEKPYYLEPAKGARKVYALLREALKKSKRIGLCRFVLKTREHIGIIKVKDDLIILDQMRYAEEILETTGLDIPEKSEVSKRELEFAIQFIDELTAPFEGDQLHDTYTAELMKMIETKHKGKEIRTVHGGKRKAATAAPDIMTQLKESLELARKGK